MKVEAKPLFQTTTEARSGADLLIELLINEGVDKLFGYPGGAVLPIYDAIFRAKGAIEHILFRHEQGSIHAAEGYARITGKPGVVIATSGPGATNLVTGITDAMMDSLPLVIFTGQVSRNVIGSDAFQEADIVGITAPITKHNYQVQSITDLPTIVKEAFHIASTGRPGPVLIDMPKDISSEKITLEPKEVKLDLPGYQPTLKPNPLQIKKLADTLANAKKPVLLAGAGVLHAKASAELAAFAKAHQLPVVTTLLGLGSFPGNDPLFLGMGGMHGTYAANMALYNCDLLINIGARFDDRLTGELKTFAAKAKVAHIDVDPAEIGKNVATQIPIVADAKEALNELNKQTIPSPNLDDWWLEINQNKERKAVPYENNEDEMDPQWLIEAVHKATKGDAIITTDVGQHQMWTAQYYSFSKPHRWVTSGGLGTMGFGFPAAIGAQFADPDSQVIAMVGDGGFQMTLQELGVVQAEKLPIKIIIMNNGALGMVRQWQEKFHGGRYSESILPSQPDFVKLAECYQIRGIRIDNKTDFMAALPDFIAYEGAALMDCRIPQHDNVYPMVAPGKGLNEMIGVKP